MRVNLRMSRGALWLLVVLLSASCGGSKPTEKPVEKPVANTIQGTVTIKSVGEDATIDQIQQMSEFAIGAPCDGSKVSKGYSDVGIGSEVVVKNEKEETIATGSIVSGSWIKRACEMKFTVDSVPKATFYKVAVGSRGGTTSSHADLEGNGWKVDLKLGY